MMSNPGGDAPAPTMRRDLASAYFASATRFGSSVIVSALVFRFIGSAEFAMLALVRGTIGILNYTSLGLAPALIHRAAEEASQPVPALSVVPDREADHSTLSYYVREPQAVRFSSSLASLYSTALAIAYAAALLGLIATLLYAVWFDSLYRVPGSLRFVMPVVVIWIGGGVLFRLAGDASGAILQIRGHIALDNSLLALGDLLWVILTAIVVFLAQSHPVEQLNLLTCAFMGASLIVFWTRLQFAQRETGIQSPHWKQIDYRAAKILLGYGLLVVAAQLADYLYAPTDYILIDRLLSPTDLAFYAPAVQIDSGLLLLVTGLSAVMLPKAALAHAAGSARTVRTYYLRGTLASFLMLSIASLCVWAAAPWILRIWLGNPMPGTQAILPLVLICTTLGGASAVGRSILLAVGKAKPFAISVLIAGVVNAVCSYIFVHYFHLGLQGILLGTVVAVVGRCVFWMPWYVLRTLGNQDVATLQDDVVPPII